MKSRFFTPSLRAFPNLVSKGLSYPVSYFFPSDTSTNKTELLCISSHTSFFTFPHISVSLFMLLRVLDELDQMLPPSGSLHWLSQRKSIFAFSKTSSTLSRSEILGGWVLEGVRPRKGEKKRTVIVSLLCARHNASAFTRVFSSSMLSIYDWAIKSLRVGSMSD